MQCQDQRVLSQLPGLDALPSTSSENSACARHWDWDQLCAIPPFPSSLPLPYLRHDDWTSRACLQAPCRMALLCVRSV